MLLIQRSKNSKLLGAAAALLFSTALVSVGCGDDDGTDNNTPNNDNGELEVPSTYSFDSRFVDGESSVAYPGQIFRQVLISDLKGFIGGMSDAIDSGSFAPASEGDVVGALDFYFRFDSSSDGDTEIGLSTDPATKQSVYDDISSGKDLVGKLAGSTANTDHKDWSTEFVGWSDTTIAENGGSINSPEGLIVAFFETLEANALARVNGDTRTGTDGKVLPVYVTKQGQDLNQLVQKFLLMAVTYSQGADGYLDDATEGKGLDVSNSHKEGSAYSALEHHWDEGFGYFGAARDYLLYTKDEILSLGYQDTDGDGAIDLLSEYNFSTAVYAAKRDLGAVAETDFTTDAMQAFLTGRAIISAAGDELTEDQKDALNAQRDIVVSAWEKTVSANVVHYINETLQEMNNFDTEEYSFVRHAKYWSEMKGFALGLQFNPRSVLSDADFAKIHELVGDAPVLADADSADIDTYKADLIAARQIIGNANNFATDNLGDDNGEGGW